MTHPPLAIVTYTSPGDFRGWCIFEFVSTGGGIRDICRASLAFGEDASLGSLSIGPEQYTERDNEHRDPASGRKLDRFVALKQG
jgi:hypothetical protein